MTPPTTPNAVSIQRLYIALNSLFVAAASIIWGVNTLFLLDAGLDIFQVMLVNATFSAGQIFFEIPTGVVADTVGRRASFLLGIGSLAVATLIYVGSSIFDWGLAGFIPASVLLGFGFTCQTGAVDAWMVDALDATGYVGSKDRIFARAGIFTTSPCSSAPWSGAPGQISLAVPYLVRTGLLVAAFFVTLVFMRDIGFRSRPFRISRLGEESRAIFAAGVSYGWRHPVVRPLLFISLFNGLLLWYFFYASQPYALELLGREGLVWLAGAVTALFALSGIGGNAVVGGISKSRWGERPARVLLWASLGASLSATGVGIVGLVSGGADRAAFALFVVLLVVFGVLDGIIRPVRQAYLNDNIPSAQRATVLSFDSFFADIGAVSGQLGLGYLAQTISKAAAYTVGGVIHLAVVPLYARARAASEQTRADSPG
jgi:MFS family permease